MLHFIHYGEQKHIDQFFEDGSIQIGTLRTYDVATHGPQIGDDEEGLSYTTLTDDVVRRLRLKREELPPHLASSFDTGCAGNVVMMTNVSFNYATFCTSRILHKKLCREFKPTYDAAIHIVRPFPFFAELATAFARSGLVDKLVFQHVADVSYRTREAEGLNDFAECFVKDDRYRHQAETRAIWNAGEHPPKFFRFKAPNAIRCCRRVLLEDMPDDSLSAG